MKNLLKQSYVLHVRHASDMLKRQQVISNPPSISHSSAQTRISHMPMLPKFTLDPTNAIDHVHPIGTISPVRKIMLLQQEPRRLS